MDTDVYNALLGAIIDSPDDDLPRLVMADFFEESGFPERGEFIRIQCDENLLKWKRDQDATDCSWGGTCDCIGHRLYRREYAMWMEFGREWFGDMVLCLDFDGFGDMSPQAVALLVDRGFPHTARGPLDWWVGGTCVGCQGNGFQTVGRFDGSVGPDSGPCHWCGGTGRTPANGPELVRKWPLTAVVATCRAPHQHNVDGIFSWFPTERASGKNPQMVPDDVWALIAGGEYNRDLHGVSFRDRKSADKALSDALLKWARSRPVTA
jgi:uncharacterized protein (TIGR02996 family)